MRMRGHHLLHSSVFTVSFGFFATSAILKETNTRTTIMERNSDHCVETGNLIQFYYATITLSYVVFIRLIYKFIELPSFFFILLFLQNKFRASNYYRFTTVNISYYNWSIIKVTQIIILYKSNITLLTQLQLSIHVMFLNLITNTDNHHHESP